MARYRSPRGRSHGLLLRLVVILATLAASGLLPGRDPTPVWADGELFAPTSATGTVDQPFPNFVRRSRFVEVQVALIDQSAAAWSAKRPAAPLILNLFSDTSVTADVSTVDAIPDTAGYVWSGTTSSPLDLVTLAVIDGKVTGNVRSNGRVYQIRPLARGGHVLSEVDESVMPPDGHTLAPSAGSAAAPPAGSAAAPQAADGQVAAAADDGSTVDLLVVYTTKARIAATDRNGMLALIAQSVSEANSALSRSGTSVKIQLVATAEIDYQEAGLAEADLKGIIGHARTAQLRNDYRADVVTLITRDMEQKWCGYASVIDTTNPQDEWRAYSVVPTRCLGSQLYLAHELGHSLGLQHDWYDTPNTEHTWAYNVGYHIEGTTKFTIMAYPRGAFTGLIPYYSNPSLRIPVDSITTYIGRASPPMAADSRRAIDEGRYTVANFRQRNGDPPPTGCSGPALTGPADGLTTSTNTLTFSWLAPTGCTYSGYTFRLKTVSTMDAGGTTLVDTGTGTTSWTQTISGFDNQDLYWGVRTANPPGAWSVRRIRIQPGTGACPGPALGGPGDDATLSSTSIFFSWSAPGGCTFSGYTFRIKTVPTMDAGGTTLVDTGTASTSRQETIPGDWQDVDLYWGVRTANPLSPNWSVRRFRVSGAPPPVYSCSPGPEGVILYARTNFDPSGGCWTVTASAASFDALQGANDNIRSIRILGPYRATLYADPNYSGQHEPFTYQDTDLTNNDIGNRASSINVERLACDPFADGVTLFSQPNWSGPCATFTSTVIDLSGTAVGNDTARSIRIRGPYRAEVFRDPNLTGFVETFLSDDSELADNQLGVSASSVRVTKLPCDPNAEGVTIFANPNFQGACATYTSDESDIGRQGMNDSVWSIRVKGPFRAWIYEHPGFSGNSDQFTWQDSNLGDNIFGNGTSSIRVARYECDPTRDGVTLFAQPSFGGICQTFTSDAPDLSSLAIGNDDTFSLQVRGPYSYALYEHPGFSGNSVSGSPSISDLRSSAIGNGASSLRVTPTAADASVEIAETTGAVTVGSPLTFTYTVRSLGPAAISSGTLTVGLPSGLPVTTVDPPGGCAGSGGTATCAIGSISAGGTKTFRLTFVPTGVGRLTTSAAVSASPADIQTWNNATSRTIDVSLGTFALNVTTTGGGIVGSVPAGIDCGATCSATFNDGTQVRLGARADGAWIFQGWSGACTGTGNCTVTMSQARSVQATFVPVSAPALSASVGRAAWGTPVDVSWSGLVISGNDWISMVRAGASESSALERRSVTSAAGTERFQPPAVGSYEFLLVRDGAPLARSTVAALTNGPPNCTLSVRPRVQSAVRKDAVGQLAVTIQAGEGALVRVDFGTGSRPLSNVVVDVNGGPSGQSQGFSYTPPPNTPQITVLLRQIIGGQAATVPLRVVDACGTWDTFVGGGSDAFR